MEENPYRASPGNGSRKMISYQTRRDIEEYETDEDSIECSGKHCRSCTGGAVADCVAICCCPCALVTILALAFVKVPLMVARKCYRLSKKKKRAKKMVEEKQKSRKNSENFSFRRVIVEKDENLRRVKKVDQDCSMQDYEEDERYGGSTRFQMEKIWMELYDQVGHLGFGRVSFSGFPVSD